MKEDLLKREDNLSIYACKSKNAVRINEESEDIRPAFFHDSDRIIHSLSYTRYIDKTQVFSFQNNDHISKRIVHVTIVSKVARTIGRFLNLNEDLIEAIALGHDIGHCPIGHVGEKILDDIAKEELNETFMHNIQSVRNYMFIENNGKGLNLSIQVLDGIMCHNGEILNKKYFPIKKTNDDILNEYYSSFSDKKTSKKMIPSTLEGCVVRISDIIAYIGRDIEDAINIGIIKRSDITNNIVNVLGNNNKDIINNIILDIVKNSYNKPYILMSDEVFDAIEELKKFNYKNIYDNANTSDTLQYYKNAFRCLYFKYLNDINNNNKESVIFKIYLNNMNNEYINNTCDERKVIDFIAGMTDDYFINQYELENANYC